MIRRRIWATTGLLGLVLGKVREQITLSVTTQHMQDNQGIRNNQHGFIKMVLLDQLGLLL